MDSASVGNEVETILQDRYPDIAFSLNFLPFERYEHIETEIADFFKKHNLDEIEVFYLYGLGLGHHFAALKSWLEAKRDRVLIILEENLGVIAAFLHSEYAQDLLAHSQVQLRYIAHPKQLTAVLKECIAQFPSDRVEIAAIAPYEKTRKFRSLKLKLFRLTTISHALMTEALYPHKMLNNLLHNILKWPGSFFANRLKQQFKGVPAIICGAGPSLSKTFAALKEVNDRALIIAGGSTIAALSNQGIIPHIGLAFDPNEEEFGRLKAASSYEMPLLYGSRLEARVLNTCNGPRGYILSDTGGPCEAHFEKALGIEEQSIGPELGVEAFSVTTLCIALAVEMGCDPIILNGIDLAYTGMQRYAEGILPTSQVFSDEVQQTKKASERLVRRKDIYGNPVHTLVKWIMESTCIADYAKCHQECRFINATQGGLGFPGIPNQPLAEIQLPEQMDLRGHLHMLIQNNPMPVSAYAVGQKMQEVLDSLIRLEKIAEQILAEITKAQAHEDSAWPSGRMTILEIDFQEEKAFGCLFPILGPALDRLFNRAHYLSPLLSKQEKRRIQLERQKAKWIKYQELMLVNKNFLHTLF